MPSSACTQCPARAFQQASPDLEAHFARPFLASSTLSASSLSLPTFLALVSPLLFFLPMSFRTKRVTSYDASFREFPFDGFPPRQPVTSHGVHLYVVNDKNKLQPCFVAAGCPQQPHFTERTNTGLNTLRKLLASELPPGKYIHTLSDGMLVTLLVATAQTHAGWLTCGVERKEKELNCAPRAREQYNLFMKTEVACIKQLRPELTHKEAFKEAARNWSMSDQNPQNDEEEEEDDDDENDETLAARARKIKKQRTGTASHTSSSNAATSASSAGTDEGDEDQLACKMKILKEAVDHANARTFGGQTRASPVSKIGFSGVQLASWTAVPWDEPELDLQPLKPVPSSGATAQPASSAVSQAAARANTEAMLSADAQIELWLNAESEDEMDSTGEEMEEKEDKASMGGATNGAGGSATAKGKGKAKVAPPQEEKKKAKAKVPRRAKKAAWTEATVEMVKALQSVAPPDQMEKPKKSFKMARVIAPPPAIDRNAAWGGDCGRFNCIDTEGFLAILQRCPLHSRLVLTTFVNKSFRMLRSEPELFASIGFFHVDSLSLAIQLCLSVNRPDSICVPAEHFANILIAMGPVVHSLSFNGFQTPLTALKASIRAVGPQLTSLSLYGEGLPNALTVKEIGAHCANLTYLDLCCGGKGSSSSDHKAVEAMEDAIIHAVKSMPHLKLLRVAPMQLFDTFLGVSIHHSMRSMREAERSVPSSCARRFASSHR